MRLSDDFDDRNSGLPIVYMSVGVILFIITVLGVVILTNKTKRRAVPPPVTAVAQEEAQALADTEDPYVSGSQTTAQDLNFWNMYDETENTTSLPEPESVESEQEEDPSTDGKHTLITSSDGTEEWVEINPYLTKNNFNYSNLVYQYPIMKFYDEGKKVSKVGVTISSEQGDVDFNKLKKAGIDFAMIRLGYRGYGSGNLMSDELYYANVNKAMEAGMDFGVIFYSQAVTAEEVMEEAARVVEGLAGFTPAYPVAFDMEYVKNDTARVQGLSRDEKTALAKTFVDAIRPFGYKTIIYGDKEWLIRRVDLNMLIEYDFWISQVMDVPDYPYKYAMWEYTRDAQIDGVEEPVSLSICMIDYSAK